MGIKRGKFSLRLLLIKALIKSLTNSKISKYAGTVIVARRTNKTITTGFSITCDLVHSLASTYLLIDAASKGELNEE